MNEALRAELIQMDEYDQTVRAELAADGSLFEGYHPRMAAVHDSNAARLRAIIVQYGWPIESLVSVDGAKAGASVAPSSRMDQLTLFSRISNSSKSISERYLRINSSSNSLDWFISSSSLRLRSNSSR